MDYMKYFKRTDIVKIFEEVCKTECMHPEKLSCSGCMVRKILDNIDELPASYVIEIEWIEKFASSPIGGATIKDMLEEWKCEQETIRDATD